MLEVTYGRYRQTSMPTFTTNALVRHIGGLRVKKTHE